MRLFKYHMPRAATLAWRIIKKRFTNRTWIISFDSSTTWRLFIERLFQGIVLALGLGFASTNCAHADNITALKDAIIGQAYRSGVFSIPAPPGGRCEIIYFSYPNFDPGLSIDIYTSGFINGCDWEIAGTPQRLGTNVITLDLYDQSETTHYGTYKFSITTFASQAITGFTATPGTGTVNSSSTLSVTGNGASGNPITYASTTPSVCSVSGTTVNYLTMGNCTVTADQAGNSTYAAAPQASISITVNSPPTTGAVSATVAANSSNNPITLNLGGGAASSVAVASVPGHGTASASGTSITYTPTPGYSGSDSFTYTAANATGPSAAATVSITVNAPLLNLTPATLSDGNVGQTYNLTVSASAGTAPYSYAVTGGGLAPGLSLASATGVISGTPTSAGTTNLTITATDAYGATGSRSYTVRMTLAVPTAGAVSATVAANSSNNPITLNLGGGAASSVAVASVPGHGTASASGTSITYTPTPGYSGSDSFTYTAANATGPSAAATVSITVSAPVLSVTPGSLSGGLVGTTYTSTISAAGGAAPYRYAVTGGSLPAGLVLDAASGAISGTLSTQGSSNFTITATDAYGATGTRSYSVTAAAPVAQTVQLPGSANTASVLVTSSQAGCTAQAGTVAIRSTNIPGAPANASFPLGALFFSTNSGCAGATVQVRIDYPTGFLAGLTPKKYGPHGTAPMQVGWYTPADLSVNGDTVTYSVTDNGEGDNETASVGVITDPFAPILLSASTNAQGIPTLGEWALGLLGLLTMSLGMQHLRQRTSTRPTDLI